MADLMDYAARLAGETGERSLPPVEQWNPAPYIVRSGLSALIARPVFYDLVGLGETREVEGEAIFGVQSGGAFFPFAPASEAYE